MWKHVNDSAEIIAITNGRPQWDMQDNRIIHAFENVLDLWNPIWKQKLK
jgi:hypothetical protein